jgi:RNA-directed DNA polymerase
MKRHSNLYRQIISIENLKLADKKARKGKLKQYGVIKHIENEEKNILNLHTLLKDKKFTTSEYKIFKISDGKERVISKLPYYPDRIVHHAIIQVLEPIFISLFTHDTYSCIKGRGIHKASHKLRKVLKYDADNTIYCLKLDIRKYFPSINNTILKQLLRRKFKDSDLLYLLDDIIDSMEGIALGNYTSQFFGNFYLAYFDHWIKENLKIKHYFKYCDDVVILHSDKEQLWEYFREIKKYLEVSLNLEIKGNYQVFPVNKRGIDFLGYKHYHTHTLLRKSIKKRYIKNKNKINHKGWTIHCDSINLRKKYENN